MATRRKPTKKAAKKAAAKAKRPATRRAPAGPKRRQPETLRLREAIAGYTVNDIEASVAWYRDVLGCVVEETWNQEGRMVGATMRTGAVKIMLGQDDWKKGHDRKKGEGFRMFATTAQDIDRLAAVIKSRGGRLTHDPMDQPWGVRDFGVVDPDGFKITISSA